MSDPANISVREDTSTTVALIEIVTVWRKFILYSLLISAALSLAVAFLIPPKFKSVASVFPAETPSLFGGLDGVSSLVKNFSPGKGLAALGGNDDLDRYMAILNSDRVLFAAINRFDLVHAYDITSYPLEKTRKELLENVDFSIEDQGYLSITVYDEDPVRAADMANFFVNELNSANRELQVQNAKANRMYVETRYQKNLVDLTAAEDSLKAFQKRYGVIAMPEQIEASVKVGADLAGQLALKEIEVGVKRRMLSPDHPEVIESQTEYDELKRKISEMNQDIPLPPGSMKLLVPFASVPDLGAQYIRKYRDVEIQYKIMQFITPLVEQAKVEEQRQTPSVIVLDKGFPAERKSKPKRTFIVLGGLLIGLLTAIGYVGASVRWQRAKRENTEMYCSVMRLANALKMDFSKRAA